MSAVFWGRDLRARLEFGRTVMALRDSGLRAAALALRAGLVFRGGLSLGRRLSLGRSLSLGAGLVLVGGMAPGAAHAETAAPTATTATYGNWTIGCSMAAQADGSGAAQVCEMTTRLNLKGKDGQPRPLLAISIGTPPGAKAPRLMLQVPTDVALREGVTLSLDQTTAAATDATVAKPQDVLAQLTYLTCTPQGCVADTDGSAELFDRLKTVKTLNVTFSSVAGAKKIMVPVSLDGFGDGFAALSANSK
ncbi:MAG: invasion associated locus B family protein [Cypionkella sp.]